MTKRMKLASVSLAALLGLVFAQDFSRAAKTPPAKGVKQFSPSLEVSAGKEEWTKYWGSAFDAAHPELLDNLREPAPPFKTRYAQPGPAWPDQVFLWDTAFVAEVWKPWDPNTAKEINLAVLDNAVDGMLQHQYGRNKKSNDTQPPVMAWAIWRLYQWTGDKDYLARAYPVLVKFNQWLYERRRLECGLFFWVHPFESGMDNSPRFASADVTVIADMKNLAAIDLSAYLVLQNETLAQMAEELEKPEEAAAFQQKARDLKAKINELLWDPEAGYYFDRDMKKGELIKVKSIASLIPLFAGVPDPSRAELIKTHIMNPAEFNTPFPLPSVARDDPSFDKDMWRGPVWINTSYMVILGLERYGYRAEAAELAFRTADGVYRNYKKTGEFWEFYDPDRDGISGLKRKTGKISLGKAQKPRPQFMGWTGLANNLVIEQLVGFKKAPGQRWIEPCFPPSAAGAKLRLSLHSEGIELELEILENGYVKGRLTAAGIGREFSLAPGKKLDLWY